MKKVASRAKATRYSPWSAESVLESMHSRFVDSYYDLYPGYSKPINKDLECAYESKRSAMREVESVMGIFQGLPNPIPVYRVIHAKSEDRIRQDALGECWSFNKKSALTFAQRNLSKPWFLMSGKVKKEDVSWGNVLSTYLEFSIGGGDCAEDEIYVPNSSSIQDLRITKVLG